MIDTLITRKLVPESQRTNLTAELFGINFPLLLEPTVFNVAGQLSRDYHGGFWLFYLLDNGGFFMAPDTDARFRVVCENGYEGKLSADALGITACLYAYSSLAFMNVCPFSNACADQYHLVREFALEHPEARAILRAID